MPAGAPRPPPRRFQRRADRRGQSETIGVILLVAVTVLGTTAIVTTGSTALTDTERAATIARTEHTMTLLDSRAAMVALGDSSMQTVAFADSGRGTYRVDSDAGWIRIVHRNYSGTGADEVIYNRSLGALVYENDNTTIAYQGGGVWRLTDDGTAQMLSRPEFHYRDATLTLPVIRVTGTGHRVGWTTATVTAPQAVDRIYPTQTGPTAGDEVGAPYNGSDRPYTNPTENGTVTIAVHSRYYRAWADYFRTRTDANVTIYDHNQTVRIELLPIGVPGRVDSLTESLQLGGYPAAHTLRNFTVTLKKDAGNWQEMHWSFYADSAGQQFEVHVTPNTNDCGELADGDQHGNVTVSVFYENGTSSQSQEWVNESVSMADGEFLQRVDCSEEALTVNFTAGATLLSYRQIAPSGFSCGPSNKWHYSSDYAQCDGAGPGTATFDQHAADGAASPQPYVPGSGHTANISFVINHYFALLGPNFELEGTEGPGGSSRVDESASSGTLSYDPQAARYLRYLHITENEITIKVE